MSIALNDNIKVSAPKPQDPRYLSLTNVPWGSIGAVNIGVPIIERHAGLTVLIGTVEYWYRNGVADVNLVLKTPDVDFSSKENVVPTGTITQYYRGDKSWQTLNKGAVGLGNVDNTSDINKPISTATQTALNSKLDEFQTDASLHFYDNTLASNISTITSTFVWNTGDTNIFTLPFTPTNLIGIFVNGLKLYKTSQFNYILPNQIQVLQTLENDDIVEFRSEERV